jgi:hypothetical protein
MCECDNRRYVGTERQSTEVNMREKRLLMMKRNWEKEDCIEVCMREEKK